MTPLLSAPDLWLAFHDGRVLFEDADLLVVDKPWGMRTHPADEGGPGDDAHSRLRAWLRARGDAEAYLGIHQRLDRDTSGVLLFTRRKEANPAIAAQFEGRAVDKAYVAAVAGFRGPARGTLRHRLVPAPGGAMRALPEPPRRGALAAPGKEAITRYAVLERRGDRALLELLPETGRTHQLRVQLAAAGFPIAGDRMYGGPPAQRVLLHAAELALRHPNTGARVAFRASQPPELEAWIRNDPPPWDVAVRAGEAAVDGIARALREAADRRYGLARAGDTTAFRLCNGGGDGLHGVAVDVYGEHLVVSLAEGDAGAPPREAVLDAAHRLGAKGVYVKVRPKHASVIVDPRRDAYAPARAVRGESAPEAFSIVELGLPLVVRLGDGLSTGVFLDQRENRRRVRALSRGARVLNLFGYTGAFTVAAAAGGALESVTVDVSRRALEHARWNLDGVGADPSAHVLVDADVFPWLKATAQAGRRFDLILLDPPSYATTKKSRFSAADDYAALAALALAALAPGGRMLACTNHRGIARARFRRHLHEAAREAGCDVTQMKDLPDPIDFPPAPGAEPHLKSVLVTIAGDPPRGPGRRGAR